MADRIISGTPVDYAQEKVLDLFCNAAKQYMVRSSIKNEIKDYHEKFYKEHPEFYFDIEGAYDVLLHSLKNGTFQSIYQTINADDKERRLEDIAAKAQDEAGYKSSDAIQYIKGIIDIIHQGYVDSIDSTDKIGYSEITSEVKRQLDAQTQQIMERMTNLLHKPKAKVRDEVNKRYRDAYHDVLFLHKDDLDKPNHNKVTLIRLFVMPQYRVLRGDKNNTKDMGLQEFIFNFSSSSMTENILLIEGDAGMGKSSLCSRLNVYAGDIFEKRPVVTVRLRDLNIAICKEQGLAKAICGYFKVEKFRELVEQYPQMVLLLDGFDELCLINNTTEPEKLLVDFEEVVENSKIKVIITSRPNYISGDLSINYMRICLEHYGKREREEWLEKFEDKNVTKENEGGCGQTVDSSIRNYILQNDDICDTPFMIYLIASGNPKDMYLDIEWSVLYQTFHENTLRTRYNETYPDNDSTTRHPINNQYKEAIYRVNEEIAYRLHCASNGKYNINSGELTEIITKIAETEPILSNESGRNIVKRSYALCTYWRVNSDDGSIEFYHNKIRDFFLCEKIYREINDIFSCDIKSDEKMLEEAIKRLCALFRHGKINETVWKYIKERTKYKRRKESREKEYPFVVQKNQNFTAVIEKMLTDSGIVFNILKNARNPIRRFCGIFGEIIKSYLFAESELLLLYKGERLKLWNDVERVNGIGLLEDIAKIGVFYNFMLSYTDLNNVVMEGADLRYVNFEGTYLQGSNLREANLCNAHMTWVHLENADLYGAHLNRAYLLVAHLNSVNLHEADLRGANLRGANLQGANLRGANFKDANIIGADFRSANLRGAVLIDGFCSESQEEQISHLCSLKISDLKV